MRYKVFLSLALLLLAAQKGATSMEGALPLSKFEVESNGIGRSGPIRVSGASSEKGVSRLEVAAFGRSYTLDESHLKKLEGAHFNGVRLSYEGGDPKLGGRALYISFSVGFTSGSELASRFVTVYENGTYSVTAVK